VDAFMGPVAVPCDDDVGAVGQWAADGFKGFSAHQDGVAAGQGFKALEVLREVPKEGIATAYEAILIVGDDEGEHSGRIELNRHRPRDMRVGIVTVQTHVVVRKVK